MSGNAAKEISQMLEGSIQKVESIVKDTREKVSQIVSVGKEIIQQGTVNAKRCGEVLDEIVSNVMEVNKMVLEISSASADSSAHATNQLNHQVENLRSVVDHSMVTLYAQKNGVDSPDFQSNGTTRAPEIGNFAKTEGSASSSSFFDRKAS